ncbi:hypothetical protein C5609_19300 [Pseudomonas putida]|uniref:hypothetical protein n=1 Tax=Pseudomonas putida TaxID=303 RepID=UPI0010705B12|nr:hypothetical protein [Pseudomonas putida]TFF50377.1 hypothetical protein C5609_19300 [Pseudomonas putida]
MSNHKISAILDKMIQKTTKGELDWQSTEKKDTYQVVFPRYSFRIFVIDKGFEEDVVVQIINQDGNILDSFTDADIRDFYDQAYAKMLSLHAAARRKAMGVEDALDELLRSLNEDDVPF